MSPGGGQVQGSPPPVVPNGAAFLGHGVVTFPNVVAVAVVVPSSQQRPQHLHQIHLRRHMVHGDVPPQDPPPIGTGPYQHGGVAVVPRRGRQNQGSDAPSAVGDVDVDVGGAIVDEGRHGLGTIVTLPGGPVEWRARMFREGPCGDLARGVQGDYGAAGRSRTRSVV